jgi:HK97 family phage prohead protease
MSTEEQEREVEHLTTNERLVLIREFPVELSEVGDGRTIDTLIVPYNTPTLVADAPDFAPYQEEWLPGCFEPQTRAANRLRVFMNFEHEGGLRGIVGHGVALEERDDFLHGTFRVHENADGDKALQLVNEGLLTGISIEAVPLRSRRVDGVVQRLRGHLDKVSLCRFPAYQQAKVLAVRAGSVVIEDVEETAPDETSEVEAETSKLAVPTLSEDLVERLDKLGIEPLKRIAITNKPWDGSPSRFTDEQYARSAVLDRGGSGPVKERYSLPVLEPDGTLNTNALAAAAARINQVSGATAAQKATAARKLIRYYRMANMETPPALMRLASQ